MAAIFVVPYNPARTNSPPPLPADPGVLAVFLRWVGRGDTRAAVDGKADRLKGGGCAALAVRDGFNVLSVPAGAPLASGRFGCPGCWAGRAN